jgi:plasmid stabilization system protein ParE
MTFKRRILKRAEAELREIFWWIEERSPDGAGRWLAAFEAAVEGTLRNLHSQPLAPEDGLVDFEARHFIFKTRRGRKYRAIFTVADDEVRIKHIRGAGQNLMDELASQWIA